MLITAVYNHDEPRLFGMPFFYWYQFAFVFVGRRVRRHRLRDHEEPAATQRRRDAGDSVRRRDGASAMSGVTLGRADRLHASCSSASR